MDRGCPTATVPIAGRRDTDAPDRATTIDSKQVHQIAIMAVVNVAVQPRLGRQQKPYGTTSSQPSWIKKKIVTVSPERFGSGEVAMTTKTCAFAGRRARTSRIDLHTTNSTTDRLTHLSQGRRKMFGDGRTMATQRSRVFRAILLLLVNATFCVTSYWTTRDEAGEVTKCSTSVQYRTLLIKELS